MTEPRSLDGPADLLRRFANQAVLVDAPEPARAEERREQVVGALRRAIQDGAERKRRAWRTRALAGLSLAASLGLGVGAMARFGHGRSEAAPGAATVSDVHGAVVVIEGGESRVLAQGRALSLRSASEVETAADAQAEIRSKRSVLRIAAATKLSVAPASVLEDRYRLSLGRVDVSAQKGATAERSVVVETPNAEVVIHGTVFAVAVAAYAENSVTDVSVSTGSAWVLSNGVKVALLGPGEHWTSEVRAVSFARASGAASHAADAPDGSEGSGISPSPSFSSASAGAASRPARVLPWAQRAATANQAKANALSEESRSFQDAIDARNHADDARAAELFGHLLSRYPGYEEAQVQLFRAEKRLGRAAAAAAEARRYLAQHPHGFAHEEARALALGAASTTLR